MRYADLVQQLLDQTPFTKRSEAESALRVSLQTLRLLVPRKVAEQLAGALPVECHSYLAPPPSPDELDGLVMSEPDGPDGAPDGPMLERVQMTCAALGPLLPQDVVARLSRELPPRLAHAFEQRARVREAALHVERTKHQATLATGRPGASHPLSESASGSHRPLSSSRADRTQSGSVAESNPHGDIKLSSSRGITQEREDQTLAKGQPK